MQSLSYCYMGYHEGHSTQHYITISNATLDQMFDALQIQIEQDILKHNAQCLYEF